MSQVSATPYPFSFDPKRCALLLIDMQRDFLEVGGFGATLGNDVRALSAIVPALSRVLGACRRAGMMVVHTREGHRPDLSDCPPSKRERGNPARRIGDMGPMGRILIRGEPGHEIIPTLAPKPGEVVIDKSGKGAFYGTELEATLRRAQISHLIVTGVTTEVCVQTTMREANDRGFSCLLLEDCTESYFPAFKKATLEMICAQGGIVGWVAPSRALLATLE